DLGFERVVELAWGATTEVGGVTVEAIPLAHWGRRWPWERWRGYNGYLLTRGETTLLFAGDTAYTPALAELGKRRPITAAIIGNGAYDPWIWNHASPEQVWQMFRESRATYLLPIHWDTFQLGKEPVGEAMSRLYAAAGSDSGKIVIRRIGDTWTLMKGASAGAARGRRSPGRAPR
ncbi:MAG: MBL fold metallo-hydrolase, partial [Candidatus Binatia bacterium]